MSSNSAINISITHTLTIHVEGPLNARTVKQFTEQATQAIENTESKWIQLFFTKESYVNSMGLSGIVNLWEFCKEREKIMSIYANEHISHLMRLSRLDKVLEINTFADVQTYQS